MGKRAVLFDFDGPLADSLAPHVEFCYDMAYKFRLRLDLPALNEGKKIAATPMDNFLRRAGFPEEVISVILANHYSRFGENYDVHLVLGVDAMIPSLNTASIKLAIVSSNEEGNIRAILGENLSSLFEAIIGQGSFASKSEGIKQALEMMGVRPEEAIYVGDTEKDWEAAQAAGVQFVGVSYGWQIEAGDSRFPVADNVAELVNILLDLLFD